MKNIEQSIWFHRNFPKIAKKCQEIAKKLFFRKSGAWSLQKTEYLHGTKLDALAE
jgi:hypothetical protein